MNEHPILFSAAMVKAILEGRKTQTRRVIKPQPDKESIPTLITKGGCIGFQEYFGHLDMPMWCCPYGQPGDHLWVRETWAGDENTGFAYKASEPDALPFGEECIFDKWKPSIHMPRKASRITLEVVNVRVERVQDISADDAWAEGCFSDKSIEVAGEWSIVTKFHHLWDSINEKRGFPWESNPWVWVVEFKRLH